MKNKRINKTVTPAISREGVEVLMNNIASWVVQRRSVESKINEAKLAIDAKWANVLAAFNSDIEESTLKLKEWAQAHPEEFKDRKSIDFASGQIGFRTGTPKLALLNRKWKWDMVLGAVARFLPNFIRSKPEIDAEAIIAQRDEIGADYLADKCGVKVVQEERFFVAPKIEEADARQVEKVEEAV